MNVLLDTSVLVGVETGRLEAEQFPDHAALSVVTLEELYLGMLRAGPHAMDQRRRTYVQARVEFDLLAVDAEVALACAQIRAEGRDRGVRYAPFDSLIGATARVHRLPLYTQDEGMVGMIGVDVQVVG